MALSKNSTLIEIHKKDKEEFMKLKNRLEEISVGKITTALLLQWLIRVGNEKLNQLEKNSDQTY